MGLSACRHALMEQCHLSITDCHQTRICLRAECRHHSRFRNTGRDMCRKETRIVVCRHVARYPRRLRQRSAFEGRCCDKRSPAIFMVPEGRLTHSSTDVNLYWAHLRKGVVHSASSHDHQ